MTNKSYKSYVVNQFEELIEKNRLLILSYLNSDLTDLFINICKVEYNELITDTIKEDSSSLLSNYMLSQSWVITIYRVFRNLDIIERDFEEVLINEGVYFYNKFDRILSFFLDRGGGHLFRALCYGFYCQLYGPL